MQPSYVTFKGIDNYRDTQFMAEIENNLKYFLDWGFLCIGAWNNNYVTGYPSGLGGNPSRLNWVSEPSYNNGQVWQAARKDWVWESGVDYSGTNPINITGVLINSIPYSTGYYINYPLGRVIFTNAIPTGSNVQLNYSYRNIQVYKADDAPWWKALQFNTNASNAQFTQDPTTGDWSIGAYHRIQLPTIVLETVPRGISKGYEIGNGALWVEQDILFHVLTETRKTRNDIISILSLQNDKVIHLFDSNAISRNRSFPLDYRGMRINSVLYPDLVSETGYRWKKCTFTKTTMAEVETYDTSLYEGIVRSTVEVVFGEI